jgi:hypothetical protein
MDETTGNGPLPPVDKDHAERGWPEGHREINATDDDIRRAGESH